MIDLNSLLNFKTSSEPGLSLVYGWFHKLLIRENVRER